MLVLISIEIMQPEGELRPDCVDEHQFKVTELARQAAAHDCVKRGTLEDIQLEKPATRQCDNTPDNILHGATI